MDRLARRETFERVFDPHALAMAGMSVAVALLFQPRPDIRALTLACAMAFSWLSGRRVPLVGTLLVMAGIVGTNLLVPVGRVLAAWGPLRITEIALREGIEKAVTFEALIYVSKACIRSDLRIPGGLGAVLGAALRSYERILEIRVKLRRATFFQDLDDVLLSVYDADGSRENARPPESRRRSGAGNLVLAILAAAAWAPYLAAFLSQ